MLTYPIPYSKIPLPTLTTGELKLIHTRKSILDEINRLMFLATTSDHVAIEFGEPQNSIKTQLINARAKLIQLDYLHPELSHLP